MQTTPKELKLEAEVRDLTLQVSELKKLLLENEENINKLEM